MTCRIRWAMTLLALGGLIVMTGCSMRQRTDVLMDKKVPGKGGPLTAELWQAADRSAEPVVQARQRFIWPLPFNQYSRQLEMHTARSQTMPGKAAGSATAWNDLLVAPPYFFISLPLRGFYGEYGYTRGTEAPDARGGMSFNPFWMWSWQDGTLPTGRSFEAWGVPLFYSRFAVAQKNASTDSALSQRNVLWTLGPRAAFLDLQGDFRNVAGGYKDGVLNLDPTLDGILTTDQYDEISGHLFNPLHLGGTLGNFLWTSYHLKMTTDTWEDTVNAHGPLLGMMIFHEKRLTDIHRAGTSKTREFDRLIFGGWLWKTWLKPTEAGEPDRELHGPLFGGFGWGRKDGEKTLRLFWSHIKI